MAGQQLFCTGDRVFYNGQHWTVVAVYNNGRMLDLYNPETGQSINTIYATDVEGT